MKFLAILILVLAMFAGAATGCGGKRTVSQSSEAPAPPPISTTAQPQGDIVISNFGYTVPPSVRPGQQLTVVNKDEAAHSVTADANNAFDVRVSGSGGVATLTAPSAPGAYPFHCKYHGGMTGTLTVQ